MLGIIRDRTQMVIPVVRGQVFAGRNSAPGEAAVFRIVRARDAYTQQQIAAPTPSLAFRRMPCTRCYTGAPADDFASGTSSRSLS